MYFFVEPVELLSVLLLLQLGDFILQLVTETIEEFFVAMLIVQNALHPFLFMSFIFET